MRALVVVDVQNDFCEGGALAVKGGNAVAKSVSEYITDHGEYYDHIVFTKDWHLPMPNNNGGHFGDPPDYENSWPVHCVGGTIGSSFHPLVSSVVKNLSTHVFYKGIGRPDYSGFQGKNTWHVLLDDFLRDKGVDEVHVCGLAADYCVKETALDAARLGYKTLILTTLTAAVHEGGLYKAVRELNQIQGI